MIELHAVPKPSTDQRIIKLSHDLSVGFGHHGLAGGLPIRGLLGVIHVTPAIPACPVATKPRQAGVWLGEGADQDLDGHRHYQGEQSQCRGNLGCYELSVMAMTQNFDQI